jgi:hypothetical protein
MTLANQKNFMSTNHSITRTIHVNPCHPGSRLIAGKKKLYATVEIIAPIIAFQPNL